MSSDVTQPFLLTVEAAARKLSISRMSMYRLIQTREFPSGKIGNSRRISVVALEAYIHQLEEASHANATG